jgi:hypothetical protein
MTSALNIVSNIAYYYELWNAITIYCIIIYHCPQLNFINNKKDKAFCKYKHRYIGWSHMLNYDIFNNIAD